MCMECNKFVYHEELDNVRIEMKSNYPGNAMFNEWQPPHHDIHHLVRR